MKHNEFTVNTDKKDSRYIQTGVNGFDKVVISGNDLVVEDIKYGDDNTVQEIIVRENSELDIE